MIQGTRMGVMTRGRSAETFFTKPTTEWRIRKFYFIHGRFFKIQGTTSTSKLVAEIAQILGIQIECATNDTRKTFGNPMRTQASLKTIHKMASGE